MNEIKFIEIAQPDYAKNTSSIAIITRWDLSSEDIDFKHHPEPLNRTADEQTYIKKIWSEALSKAEKDGRELYDGVLVGLGSLQLQSGVVGKLYPLNYSEYVVTRDQAFLEAFPHGLIANPLGTSIVSVTADNQIVIGLRGKTDNNRSTWYVPGGFVEPQEDIQLNGRVDIFGTAVRELNEELGVQEVVKIVSTGVSYDRRTPHPEIHFASNLGATSQEIMRKFSDKGEFSRIKMIPNQPDILYESLVEIDGQRMCGAGACALLLHGRLQFGDGWFFKASQLISGPVY